MPQMAPINWLSLFIMFSMTFLIFNMMNFYFFKTTMPKSISYSKNIFYFNWKW